jgi:competence ComEA-like helix-hairpin-helix protein
MPNTSTNPKDKELKEDDRLIILFGIGMLLFLIHCFQSMHFHSLSSHKNLKLQWNGTDLIVKEAGLPFLTEDNDSQDLDNLLIPAAYTPFFFAPLPVNEANQKLLETLPGIGPSLASEIIRIRSLHGPFRYPEDLLKISGIGRKRMLKFSDQFSFR